MCGFYFILRNGQCCCDLTYLTDRLKEALYHRGPDAQDIYEVNAGNFRLSFYATLLWLRGSEPFQQPAKKNGTVLLWNGDIYDVSLPENMSDTEYILNNLEHSSQSHDVIEFMKCLKGPGSWVFFHPSLNSIWFGRDVFGRHSLLQEKTPCHLILSSVGIQGSNLIEVPANGIFQIELNESEEKSKQTNLKFSLKESTKY